MGQNIRLTAADGHEMGAYLAEPSGPARGAIVVAMEMYGVNDYLRTVCDNYAADGYVAIAPQFFDRFAPDVNFPYDGSAYGLAKQYSADVVPHIVTDAEAAMAHVRAAGKVAISGYCFGGLPLGFRCGDCLLRLRYVRLPGRGSALSGHLPCRRQGHGGAARRCRDVQGTAAGMPLVRLSRRTSRFRQLDPCGAL